MIVLDRIAVASLFDESKALEDIRQAFIAFSLGRTDVAAIGELLFDEPPGDVHVKSARIRGDDIFVVKVAGSFYANPAQGLSSSQGMQLIFSAVTGEALAVLNDGGFLTDQRTALAGVLAAQLIAKPGSKTLGIVGTGIQAHLQASALIRHMGFERILIWGRHPLAAHALADAVGGEVAALADLVVSADLVVTTTPSSEPLIKNDWIRAGSRIVAVGADSLGKRELEPEILARARVVVDSHRQCLQIGETSWAVNAGIVDPESLFELGTLLKAPPLIGPQEVVVVDLTGVAVQDAAIAGHIWKQKNSA